jgi:hypothetical protein
MNSARPLLLGLLFISSTQCLVLQRVIVSCDTNPMYSDFWPIVAKFWREVVGVKPTLALIAPPDFIIDESLGDVIRFDPIPGVPAAFHAQAIRLLLPAYFEDEVCIISDIDLIPLQKDYFVKSIESFDESKFIVYRDGAFNADYYKEYPMCYNAAMGKVFKQIFKLNDVKDIPTLIYEWHKLNLCNMADQLILYKYLNAQENCSCIVKLGHTVVNRIDRACWRYNKDLVKNRYYIDSHMLRPYSDYKYYIDSLVSDFFDF